MTRVLHGLLYIFVALVFLATPAAAGSERGGLVFGLSVGPGVVQFSQRLEGGTVSVPNKWQSKRTVEVDWRIGYGPSRQVSLFLLSHGSVFFVGDSGSNDDRFMSSLVALAAAYYFDVKSPSLYITGATGPASWSRTKTGVPGWGARGGVGFEFSRHASLELATMWCRTQGQFVDGKLITNAVSTALTFNLVEH